MAFEFLAERGSETVRFKHNSSLIAVAKARVWASEGWDVTIVVEDEVPLIAEPPCDDIETLDTPASPIAPFALRAYDLQ